MPKYEIIVNVHIQDFEGPEAAATKAFVEAYLTQAIKALEVVNRCKTTVDVEHIEEQ